MNHYAHPEVIVDSQWLADLLDDAGIYIGLWGMQGVFWATAGLAVAAFAVFHFLLPQAGSNSAPR